MSNEAIGSVGEFLAVIKEETSGWLPVYARWFRGQPVDKPLKPRLFREEAGHNENALNQLFRSSACALEGAPPQKEIHEWLLLAQHFGLPTRLLDWTEHALVALFFAVYEWEKQKEEDLKPVVWILNPTTLNAKSTGHRLVEIVYGPLATGNFALAFGAPVPDCRPTHLPLAVLTPKIHMRMWAQASCFTLHGHREEGLDDLRDEIGPDECGYLAKCSIDESKAPEILGDLEILGISYSRLFPDFGGIAKELRERH